MVVAVVCVGGYKCAGVSVVIDAALGGVGLGVGLGASD